VAFGVIALAQPTVSTLFGTKYSHSPLYLALYVVVFIYTAFGYLSIENILKSQGRTDINMKLVLLTSGISLVLNLILIPPFGILGLLVTNIFATIPTILVALWWIQKKFNATIDWKSSARVVLASGAASLITYLVVSTLMLPSLLTLVLGLMLFSVCYLFLAPMLGAITNADVNNFKDMLTGIGPLAPLFSLPLSVIENLTKLFQSS
jgi:O-antigen/teichoic acid export membrane protein